MKTPHYDPAYIEMADLLTEPYFEALPTGELVLINRALHDLVGDASGKKIWDLFGSGRTDDIRLLVSLVIAEKRQKALELTLVLGENSRPARLHCSLTNNSAYSESSGADGGPPVTRLRGRITILADASAPDGGDSGEARRSAERQAKELAILNHLSEAISSSLELEDILHAICREMLKVFNARNVGIALLNPDRTKLKIVAFHTEQEAESDATGLEFDIHGNDASLFVIQTGEPIVVPDAQFNPITSSLHQVMLKRGTVCLLVVPLLARGEVIGTIGVPSNSREIFNQEDVRLAQTIASQVASVIDNARLHQSVKQARDVAERELEIGRQIQTGFFPESLPRLSGWNLNAHFLSARQVAGDFYDVFPLGSSRIGLVLADVCDKGVGAALFMVVFRSLLRAHFQKAFRPDQFSVPDQLVVDPSEVVISAVHETNNYVAINHARANMFATVFAAIVEADSDALWYVNCGHDAPVVVRKSGEIERLAPTSAAIGMFADLNISAGHTEIRPGDSLIAFTDGVTDARSPDGSLFGEQRLLSLLVARRPLEHRLDMLKMELTRHIGDGDQYDDITCIGLERS